MSTKKLIKTFKDNENNEYKLFFNKITLTYNIKIGNLLIESHSKSDILKVIGLYI